MGIAGALEEALGTGLEEAGTEKVILNVADVLTPDAAKAKAEKYAMASMYKKRPKSAKAVGVKKLGGKYNRWEVTLNVVHDIEVEAIEGDLDALEETVKAGTFFAVVDVSVAGGRMAFDMGFASALAEAVASDGGGLDEVKMGTPFGRLPQNHLMKNPAGTWSFVGSVDARLSYVKTDGKPLGKGDEDTIEKAKEFGPRLAGVKSRAFKTPYEAMMAAKKLGQSVTIAGWEMKKHPEIKKGLDKSKVKHRISEDTDADLDGLEETVKAGVFFVVVDVSVAGGRMAVDKIFKGVKGADAAAKKLRDKGRNVQVIDALWYEPARKKLQAAGIVPVGESLDVLFTKAIEENLSATS